MNGLLNFFDYMDRVFPFPFVPAEHSEDGEIEKETEDDLLHTQREV